MLSSTQFQIVCDCRLRFNKRIEIKGIRLRLDSIPAPQAIGTPPSKDFGGLISALPYSFTGKIQRIKDLIDEISENNKQLNKKLVLALIYILAAIVTILLLLKAIDNFYKEKISIKSFSLKKLNNIFYYQGKQSVLDILSYRLFTTKKSEKNLLDYIDHFGSKVLPIMPIGAKVLMEKFNIPEGKNLGNKLKIIEEEWVNNNFQLTDQQINKIIIN